MNFSEYEQRAMARAIYPEIGKNFVFPTLALTEEAGEVAGKIKKLMRDRGVFQPRDLTDEDRGALIKEMGDVLWYLTALAQEIGVTLENVAESNLAKIDSRHERGVQQGSGDNR